MRFDYSFTSFSNLFAVTCASGVKRADFFLLVLELHDIFTVSIRT